MTFFLVALSAFVAGLVNAVAGGGTFLTFPVLTGIAGLSQKVANMTSTDGLWPGSAASVAAAWKDFGRIPRGMLIAFGTVSAAGGALGSIILMRGSTKSFELAIPWLLAFATIVFGCSKPIARWAGRQHGHRTRGWTAAVVAVQFFLAVYGGYFGAGMGVLMLAGFAFAGLDDIHQMNALKVLLATIVNGVAALLFLFNRQVRWDVVGIMAVASIAGGFLGMSAARRVKPSQLRLLILGIGIILTGFYFAKNYLHA